MLAHTTERVLVDPVTGVYCRPACHRARESTTSHLPRAAEVSRLAADVIGLVPCGSCRPAQADRHGLDPAMLTDHALRALRDGRVDEHGVLGLAASLAISSRHLHRLVVEATGSSPQQLALARRVQTARTLLAHTDLPLRCVGATAGFASERQHSAVLNALTGLPPGRLREQLRMHDLHGSSAHTGRAVRLLLHLGYEPPFEWAALTMLQRQHAVAGLTGFDRTRCSVATSIATRHGSALAVVRPSSAGPHVMADVALDDVRDLGPAIVAVRRWLGLDIPIVAVERQLSRDPTTRRLLRSRSGLRPPGAVDAVTVVVLAVLLDSVPQPLARHAAALLLEHHDRKGHRGALVPPPAGEVLDRLELVRSRTRLQPTTTGPLRDVLAGLASGSAPEEVLSTRGVGDGARAYVRLRLLSDLAALPPATSGVARATGLSLGGSHAAATRFPGLSSLVWTHSWAVSVAARSGLAAGSRMSVAS